VAGLGGVVAVAAGYEQSLALESDGSVWAWGDNYYGELGLGAADPGLHATPARLGSLAGVSGVKSGGYHSLALKSDGSVWSWGHNTRGEVGNGTTGTTGCGCVAVPTQVSALAGLNAIAAGFDFSLALKRDPYARTEDSSSSIRYQGAWAVLHDARTSGGTAHYASVATATASFTWTGTGIEVVMARGPQLGKARITLDGVATTVDLYAATLQPQQVTYEQHGLAPGQHTIQVMPTGLKNSRSSGTIVPLDALDTR
jgi:hypothetical protein